MGQEDCSANAGTIGIIVDKGEIGAKVIHDDSRCRRQNASRCSCEERVRIEGIAEAKTIQPFEHADFQHDLVLTNGEAHDDVFYVLSGRQPVKDKTVVASPTRQDVRVSTAVKHVSTVAADQDVMTHIARQRVIAGSAIENLIGKASLTGTCFCASDVAMRSKARLGVNMATPDKIKCKKIVLYR